MSNIIYICIHMHNIFNMKVLEETCFSSLCIECGTSYLPTSCAVDFVHQE